MGRTKGSKNKKSMTPLTTRSDVEIIEPEVEDERSYDLIINVNNTWRIVKLDAYQFQLQNFRVPEETARNKDMVRTGKWFAMGYYPSLSVACQCLFDKMLLDKKGQFTLSEFILITREIRESIEKALGYGSK